MNALIGSAPMFRLSFAPLLAALFLAPALLFGQGSRSCAVNHTPPGDAEKAMDRHDLAAAEQIYTAALKQNPADIPATVGLIRAQLAGQQVESALTLARKALADHPHDPDVAAALGEVALRRGEPETALDSFLQAIKIDPCLPRVHLDLSRYLALGAMWASSRRQLDLAHSLAPADPAIRRAWDRANFEASTPQQRIARLEARLAAPDASPEEKAAAEKSIRYLQALGRGDCQPVGDLRSAAIRMEDISNGPALPNYAVGLDTYMNGKRKRLEIDSGASGILLSRGAALSAGLVPEAEVSAAGLGDKGARSTFVTHVDSLRIGSMEFRNCIVHVVEKRNILEVDGLIGPDVFRNYLVTLDIPARELRLAPLPAPPDQAPQPAGLATTGEGTEAQPALDTQPALHDRYIAPEMKNWARVYRIGHDLIFPTYLISPKGDPITPPRLFVMDTGAATPIISPDAARVVTHVEQDFHTHLRGVSGEVRDVLQADLLTIQFAGLRQQMRGTVSVDLSGISRDVGMEIGGFIAFPTLRDLTLTIDYRDNLVDVVYDPKHGSHPH